MVIIMVLMPILLWAPLRRGLVWICFVLIWASFLAEGWNRFGSLILALVCIRVGYTPPAVQFQLDGGKFDFAHSPARTPHGTCV